MKNKNFYKLFRSLTWQIQPSEYDLIIKYLNLISIICVSIQNHKFLELLSSQLFSFQILCYTNSLIFQDLLFSKNFLANLMIIGQGLLLVCFFPSRQDLSMSLADNFSFISFSKNYTTSLPVSSSLFSFTSWIRRQFLLESYSW